MISTDPLKELRIDGDRLWQRLHDMAQVGKTIENAVSRLALTDEDRQGRDLFKQWSSEAGCSISVDQIGNIFARRAGREDHLEPVLVGSHLDGIPAGGKFDGAYGVLAGLEVLETLNDEKITTVRPLEVAIWTNEAGVRFSPAMLGSGVFAGIFDLQYGLARIDENGQTLGEELARIGYKGVLEPGGRNCKAFFELHSEQGPILQIAGKSIGVVTGIQGTRWYEIVISGREDHAGTTPMEIRRDPVKGMLTILQEIYNLAERYYPEGRATIGDIQVKPGNISSVPSRLTFKLDLRHSELVILRAMHQALHGLVYDVCNMSGLNGEVHDIWHSDPVVFNADCIKSLQKAARDVGLEWMDIVSGENHDAAYISHVAPTGMIFVPSRPGSSPGEPESVSKADAISGANVLLHAVLGQASS